LLIIKNFVPWQKRAHYSNSANFIRSIYRW
jgi:hypothetical protein